MGMLSRAMKSRKKEMLDELEHEQNLQTTTQTPIIKVVSLPDEVAQTLHEISQMRGIAVEQLVAVHMNAVANAYKKSKIIRLIDFMPYGKYQGALVEDMIRADPRYVNWLAGTSDIFVLDEEATQLLKELS